MALESLGRVDGYDQDGRARRVIVYHRNGTTLFALAARRYVIASVELDYAAAAAQAFGIRDCQFHPD